MTQAEAMPVVKASSLIKNAAIWQFVADYFVEVLEKHCLGQALCMNLIRRRHVFAGLVTAG
jgi:hypothetical protein